MNYTVLYWPLLNHFQLSMPEYALIDLIHGLSGKTGWCYASRSRLAQALHMKPRWVFESLSLLSQKGLIEIDPKTRYLRTSPQWKQALTDCQQHVPLPPPTQTDVPELPRRRKKQPINPDAQQAQDPETTPSILYPDSYAKNTDAKKTDALNTDAENADPTDGPMHAVHTPYAQNTEVPMQTMHTPYALNAEQPMQKTQSTYAQNAHNTNIYTNTDINTDTNNGIDTLQHKKYTAAQGVLGQKEKEGNQRLTGDEIFLEPEPLKTETHAVEENAPVITPPPHAAAPSPEKSVTAKTTPAKATKSKATVSAHDETEPCLADCRKLYLQQFSMYQWQHGRDDKFLKDVLGQIRFKIAARLGQRDLLLRQVDADAVVASFGVLIRHIPEWYRDNGYTTPLDLNRYFERYFTAIQSGQGGGMAHSLKPGTAEDLETVRLLLKYR